MTVQEEINAYLSGLPEPKRSDMQSLHYIIQDVMPESKLWFMDGKDSENKNVSNPNIGYGFQILKYADGTFREFYQIGISANKTGISIYILTFADRSYLAKTYREKLGKANVTSYCIKFKNLKDINTEQLKAALQDGFGMKF